MIGYWAKWLDTAIGSLFFTLGVVLVALSLISIGKEAIKEKEEK